MKSGGLAAFIELFRRERILWDYLEDGKLMVRLNQIMRRVRLERLPDDFAAVLPAARILVTERKRLLLEGIPSVPSVASCKIRGRFGCGSVVPGRAISR